MKYLPRNLYSNPHLEIILTLLSLLPCFRDFQLLPLKFIFTRYLIHRGVWSNHHRISFFEMLAQSRFYLQKGFHEIIS